MLCDAERRRFLMKAFSDATAEAAVPAEAAALADFFKPLSILERALVRCTPRTAAQTLRAARNTVSFSLLGISRATFNVSSSRSGDAEWRREPQTQAPLLKACSTPDVLNPWAKYCTRASIKTSVG